ncbi:AraC family transcriptional regulator [Paenibacillus sp. JDR-2]|uniref:AraC family transcriptional regulator n=1 Tax=Paenibacillus sp. (strain JDR-2) TaxID=324057 RepID=UPI00016667A4|nr:AraC family transcriptional regulator [Paenibacillus sp. JDR-2]ACS99841.1 transcriptional regulator, AraC family [Paenibacillus sp. JDR-2]
MNLERTHLNLLFDIRSIITMFYFEFDGNYRFPGEQHDFWELVYVDKGEIEVGAGSRRYMLKQGGLIFHKPNEFHSLTAIPGKAPNVIVMTFDCHSKEMDRLSDKVFLLDHEQLSVMARILSEGANAFALPFHYPLVRKPNPSLGSEQLVKIHLESLLILLLRGDTSRDYGRAPMLLTKEKEEARLVSAIVSLMEERLSSQLSLLEISRTLHIANTKLKEQFKRHTGKTVMEYYAHMKLEKAKLLIREDGHNFTEIALQLGFSSVHYFSKAFKRSTGMSPSEYAKSVKARSRIEQKANDYFISNLEVSI